eukprot:5679473-Prorocentrum_lima.AAC.1
MGWGPALEEKAGAPRRGDDETCGAVCASGASWATCTSISSTPATAVGSQMLARWGTLGCVLAC